MNELDKDINSLINNALKESNEYLEMYELKIRNCNDILKELDDNKPKSFLKKQFCIYEEERNKIINDIKKYEEKIIEEKKIIEIMKKI